MMGSTAKAAWRPTAAMHAVTACAYATACIRHSLHVGGVRMSAGDPGYQLCRMQYVPYVCFVCSRDKEGVLGWGAVCCLR
jgi:hypothetical protein